MNPGASIWLNEIASAWSSWMLGMAWIVAALVVALSLITAVLKGRSASLLYALWLLVLIRLVLPPDFAFPTGWGWWVRSEPVAGPSAADPAPPPSENRIGSATGGPRGPSPSPSDFTSPTSVPIAMVLMIAWLGIAAARCGMLFTAALQVQVWVSRALPVLDPALVELLDESRERVGVRRKVELRNSEACSTPLVVGVWKPVLLLPAAVLDRLSADQLRSVLIHELLHVKRWDGLVNLLQGLLGAAYFFHPVVWWANRRIRQLREDACDERTVAILQGNRKPYGEAIFRVAEILGYSAPPLTLGVLDSTSPLAQRLQRILDPRLPIEGGRPWQSVLILAVAMATLLPAGAKPAASGDSATERRIAAESMALGPLTVKKHRAPRPATRTSEEPTEAAAETHASAEGPPTSAEEPVRAESVTEQAPKRHDDSEAAPPPIGELVEGLGVADSRAGAVESLIAAGSAAEPELLRTLPNASSETRAAIYEVLASIGTERSLLPLQQALLAGNAFEERRIRQALDRIYGRMEIPISRFAPSINSSRVYERDEPDDDGF